MGKILLVVLVFAALVYAVFWLLERRRGGNGGGGSGGQLRPRGSQPPHRPSPRTIAPDDDEDFLRDLNRRNRRRDKDRDNGD